MKKFFTLAIILFVATTSCATAGDKPAPAKQKNPEVNSTQLIENIKKQIAEYDKPIADAKAKLEALPAWKEYLAERAIYNDALKAFQKADKKAANLQEFKVLHYLEGRQMELKKLLEGAK